MNALKTITSHLPKLTPENYIPREGIATNNGLHGNVLLFEVNDFQLEFSGANVKSQNNSIDALEFTYTSFDSDEGEVFIRYRAHNGDAVQTLNGVDEGCWDVEISTGSDGWGLLRTQEAIAAAIKLHIALGHDTPLRPADR